MRPPSTAATGWLELGNWREANEELEEIEAAWRAHPDVLEVRWRIYARAGKWEAAVEIATAAMKMAPARAAETMYALAVAACAANRIEDARKWASKAFAAGGNAMKQRALDDPALEVLWIGE